MFTQKIWFMLISLFKKKLTIDYLAGRMEVKEIFDDHIDFLKGQEIVKVLYMNTDYDYLKARKILKDFLKRNPEFKKDKRFSPYGILLF